LSISKDSESPTEKKKKNPAPPFEHPPKLALENAWGKKEAFKWVKGKKKLRVASRIG